MTQYELSLRDYWRVLRKRRLIIIPVFLIIFAGTLAYSYFQSPVYQASATVQYSEQRSLSALLTELVNYPIGDVMLSQAKVAQCWSVIEIAARKMGSVKEDATADEANKVISRIQRTVSTDIEKNTNIIVITVRTDDPKTTALIANAVAEAYQQYNRQEKSKTVTQLRQTIENRLTQTKQKLDKTEEELRVFKEQNPEITGGASSIYNKYEDLKKRREELVGKYTDKHPEVVKLNIMMDTYRKDLARYPDKELAFSRLSREVTLYNTIYGELKQQLERAWLDEAEKTSDISLINQASTPVAPIFPSKAKNQVVGIMLGLVAGIVLAFVVEHLDTSIATIEEIESLLKIPVVGVIPFLSKGTVLSESKSSSGKGKGKGDLLTWLFGLPPPKPRSGGLTSHQGKGETSHGDRMMGERSGSIRSQLVLNYSPTSPLTEAYRTLRTNLLRTDATPMENIQPQWIDPQLHAQPHSGIPSYAVPELRSGEGQGRPDEKFFPQASLAGGRKGKIIIITSTGPEEGKSITAINLSITMAQKGELVLLVDTDMRKAIIHKVFGLDREHGLSDVIMGSDQMESVIHNITDALIGGLDWDMVVKTPGIDNLHIMTAGSNVPNPSELLSSPESDNLLRKLRERYNYIILDCPPILPVTDVLILGPKSEIVTMVYRAGRTAKNALLRAKEQLTAAQIKIKGLILNYITPEIEISPTYYYHAYRYYQTDSNKK